MDMDRGEKYTELVDMSDDERGRGSDLASKNISEDMKEDSELDRDRGGGDGIGDGSCSGAMRLEDSSSMVEVKVYFCKIRSLSKDHS
jgi:hypothetical protein